MARVLIVLDGDYRFSAIADGGTTDFTYVALLGTLLAAGHQITKAHRQSDSSADHTDFDFATTLDLLDFDLLWLIGLDGRNVVGSSTKLPDPELQAIAAFMQAGGGVFATGDHDSIGSDMCGHIPRVRAMRSWYGEGDPTSPMPNDFPRNYPPLGSGRADTTRRNPAGSYDIDDDGMEDNVVWFENQSDAIPQTISALTSPEFPDPHEILRDAGETITVYPDHMHEGNTLGEVPGYPYATASVTVSGETFTEFPEVDGHREIPRIIAQGVTTGYASAFASSGSIIDNAVPNPKTVNTLSVYDGRGVGVGRVVTGSTFHHYVDINLTGDSRIDTADEFALTGPDAAKGHGFNDDPAVFAKIKTVHQNIAAWLARPRPRVQLILERSTFSQAEVAADPVFDGAILVTIDGLKPNQFPNGGITTLSPSSAQLHDWAPGISQPSGISITPTDVSSDDPGLHDRLQRITFTYRVQIAGSAFGFADGFQHISIGATLNTPAASAPLTDAAQITLVKSANPFMLDLADGNERPWLSTDVRVYPVVAGAPGSPLPDNATRAQALAYLDTLLANMTLADFEALESGQEASALSPLATTTGDPSRRVYNFGIARVRLPSAGSSANDVRVFFRIFTSQTTAALTYRESPAGTPIEGYLKTDGPDPVALPGENGAGTEWLSFPMFAAAREATPASQMDPANVANSIAPGTSRFFGCLIDNNLSGAYLPPSPTGGANVDLPSLLMGEHQCIVAQVEFAGTPIPNGANPFTSDKLSQRNIAISEIANPGVDASRWALHTFEIEGSSHPHGGELPDELLIDWTRGVPENTELRIRIPGWNAFDVVALAGRIYPRHDLRALDEATVALPAGGTRYVPLPPSGGRRTGVMIIAFPLGVSAGQRFDMSVRQISNNGRSAGRTQPPVKTITAKEADRHLRALKEQGGAGRGDDVGQIPAGVFELGDNRTLVTDLSVINAKGDEALIVSQPDAAALAAEARPDRRWRAVVGAFQIGVPVSVKEQMLGYHLRLLSVMRFRLEALRPNSRWYPAFSAYVALLTEKVVALGGNPAAVRPTPDGEIEIPGIGSSDDSGTGSSADTGDRFLEPGRDAWLGGTTGLPDPVASHPLVLSGKVSGLIYDHFGDFEGLTLETYDGTHHRFYSREGAIEDLARNAWIERYIVTVMTVERGSRELRRLLLRGV